MNQAAYLASTGLSPAAGIVMMAARTVADLSEERDNLLAEGEALLAAADEEDREPTAEEVARGEEIRASITALDRQISLRQSFADARTPPSPGRRTAAELQDRGGDNGTGGRRVPATARDNARHNFANFGEFALGVRAIVSGNGDYEPAKKVQAAATTYGNEGAGAEGGFLVPPEFSRQIWSKVEAEENLMNRCTVLTPSGNSMAIPKDETTPWGTAGVRVYWEAEAAQATASKASFELSNLRLYKLMALAPASEELIEDAMGYESYLQAVVPGRMSAAINTAIVSGSGAGQPLGILNAPSLISVAKQTSQPADTVWMQNIEKMWARMYAPWRRNAIWLINQDIEPSLGGMAFQATGASSDLPGTSAVPAYLPPGGLSNAPYGSLKGRPVVPLEAAKAVGDQGDIMLVDLRQYWVLRKAAGMKADTSMHLYFDQALTAFRFIFRINGQPMWSSTIARQNGSNTLSWAVTLDAR
ncbi:MAG: phage major capsid protein [Reyranella sp.]|uniref:phage major capsid protein n=1 Tax=Reyranella sp. TaxID=1929291 RepID=UPI003D099030